MQASYFQRRSIVQLRQTLHIAVTYVVLSVVSAAIEVPPCRWTVASSSPAGPGIRFFFCLFRDVAWAPDDDFERTVFAVLGRLPELLTGSDPCRGRAAGVIVGPGRVRDEFVPLDAARPEFRSKPDSFAAWRACAVCEVTGVRLKLRFVVSPVLRCG